jgi:enterochelin esterase family protein
MHPPFVSPRIADLQRQLEAGDSGALDDFWEEVAARGAPLIEPLPDQRHALVTFLWRASDDRERAAVITQLAPRLHGTGAAPLVRLLGSNLWYGTFRARIDLRTTYWLSVSTGAAEGAAARPEDQVNGWITDDKNWRADPLNPRATPEQPPASLLTLSDAPAAPWSAVGEGAAGAVATHKIRSETLGNERTGWVYTPPGYDPAGGPAGGPYDFLLLFDGWAYANCVPTATILDNLITAGRLPPTVGLLLGNPSAQARQKELGCHEPFVDFVAAELLPWVRDRYAVTPDPTRCVVGGSSRGGLAAAFVGLRRPELFGNVLCQSGAFLFRPEGDPEPEWLARQFAAAPRQPLRFHLDVGLLEVGVEDDGAPTMLTVTRHMRDVLRAKGYDVHYAEFSGGHSYSCWEAALPEGLGSLLGSRRR